MPAELPPNVEKFLKRTDAQYHGSFTYSTDDPDLLVALRKKTPKGHLTVELDNYPVKPEVWFICSEPHKVGGNELIKDVPYSLAEEAA